MIFPTGGAGKLLVPTRWFSTLSELGVYTRAVVMYRLALIYSHCLGRLIPTASESEGKSCVYPSLNFRNSG